MSSDKVPEKVLQERLKAKEDELKKKERELRVRDQNLREKQDEMDSAKASCDALMLELHSREQKLGEIEKKHGSLKKREDDAAAREAILQEKEAALRDRQRVAAKSQQDHLQKNRARDAAAREREEQLNAKEAMLNAKLTEVEHAQTVLENAKAAHIQQCKDADENLKFRDRQMSDAEARLMSLRKQQEQLVLEVDNMKEAAQDRAAQLKAETVDVGAREQKVKWRENELQALWDKAAEQKTKLLQWENNLEAQQEEQHSEAAKLQMIAAQQDAKTLELQVRLSQYLAAERVVEQREAAAAQRTEELDEQERRLVALSVKLNANEKTVLEATRIATDQTETLRKDQEELNRQRKQLNAHQRVLREKERALKDWLVELDFRQKAIMHREQHPRPYLLANSEVSNTLGSGLSVDPADEPVLLLMGQQQQLQGQHDITPNFNQGIVEFQVEQIQRAYLGASLKSKQQRTLSAAQHRATTPLERIRVSTATVYGSTAGALPTSSKLPEMDTRRPPSRNSGERSSTATGVQSVGVNSFTRDVFDKSVDVKVQKELDVATHKFREFAAAFVVLDDAERRRFFTFDEEEMLREAINSDTHFFDECCFLEEILKEPILPNMALNCSPQDAKVLAAVKRWAADKKAVVSERKRRVAARRLRLLQPVLQLAESKSCIINAKQQRHAALLELPYSDGSMPRIGHQSQSRTPAVIEGNIGPISENDSEEDCSAAALPPLGAERPLTKPQATSPIGKPPRPRSSVSSGAGSRPATGAASHTRPGSAATTGSTASSEDVDWGGGDVVVSPTKLEPKEDPGSMPSMKPEELHTEPVKKSKTTSNVNASEKAKLVDALPSYLRKHYM